MAARKRIVCGLSQKVSCTSWFIGPSSNKFFRIERSLLLTTNIITSVLINLKPVKHIYVAYSGGVDSHVLLHLCANMPKLHSRLTAVYVHHGLQAEADDWAVHCEQVSRQLGVAFICLSVEAQAANGVSPEEAARDARYQALATLLSRDDVLLLAQHQDDQLETVLLQLFRGAGLRGLAGMPVIAPLGLGHSVRPLLTITKQAILAYAEQQSMSWVEDPTNQSNAFDRNLLRNTVLPLLTERWPMLATTVARSARHCAEAHEALQVQTELALKTVLDVNTQAIDIEKLSAHSAYQQRLIIRYWLQAQGLKLPSEALLLAVFEQVIGARQSRDPELIYQQASIRRFRNQLYCLPLASLKSPIIEAPLVWPTGQAALTINEHSHLTVVGAENGINRDVWQAAVITVRFRQGGEKIALMGRAGRQSLKNLCQEAAIPPWQRDKLPLVYLDGQLAAVADCWISREVWTEDANKSVRLAWQKNCA
ncbi:MAG: tRNA lysidine(34) synthetase TilS [Methylococcaceae bacterium]|nr:tRNA lysidine(34) synthetase TilS [Methylococcaceae bacterium]